MKHKISILPSGKQIFADSGDNLLECLAANGFFLPAACGGNGTCGKCKVYLLDGKTDGTSPDEHGALLSCRAFVCEDIVISLPDAEGEGLCDFANVTETGNAQGLGMVLDIGTTTLAACLIDLATGKILKKHACLNPQGVCGADVLSRIQAYAEGKGKLLQDLILKKTSEILSALVEDESLLPIDTLVIAANTTMLHLFLCTDPSTIGAYPFTPVFTDTQRVTGESLGIQAKEVRLLPSAGAYIGSDITAGILACGMHAKKSTELFVDIGTNGEIVLAHEGKLYAASTAAGPALEGACIECGMGGIAGAIDKVSLENGKLCFSTIGNAPARGICGSGLIDLFALLLNEGLIDETGAWDPDATSPLVHTLDDDRFYLTDDIYLSQQDIRQFQLAKAAIAAGIYTLLASCNINEESVQALHLAGGLGFYMNIENAAKTGLLPRKMIHCAKAVGNTALAGSHHCILSDDAQKHIEKLATDIEIVELSFSQVFQEQYMENMMFLREE